MNGSRVSQLGSLRTRVLLLLLSAAVISAISAALLTYGLTSSQQLVDKAQAAQIRIETYLVLASRLSEYRDAASAAIAPQANRELARKQINQAYEPVRRTFTRLLSLNVLEVDSETGDDKSAAATKGLNLSRMKAQFDNLHRSMGSALAESTSAASGQGALNAFGIGISPILFQAIDNERQLSATMHRRIASLRERFIAIAIALVSATVLLSLLIYFRFGLPLLRRIAETVQGAEAIAEGKLTTRLNPTGHDELTDLMRRFNMMAGSLAAREDVLKTAQRDLQETVDRQTADLRQANEKLEKIDTNRRRFFSDISHELRTPLTVVQGEAEYNLNAKARPGVADMRQSFETILGRVQELRRRVDDMLRVARSESGRLDLSSTRIDLNQVVGDAVGDETRPAKRRGVELKLAAVSGELAILGDYDWLRQVLGGLIVNAVKNSPEKTLIRINVSQQLENAVITVEDQGRGIDPDSLPHVFERFTRAGGDNLQAETEGDGFGIGLNLAKWVIEEHSGSISLGNNVDGPGVTVHVTLPLMSGSIDQDKTT
ncbi:ATP-binding protein [Anderseniella sp. Alg231-50]|uniref:ATP-binding protein n=1 Tax=Anderseniella sp. Alg231-50 TaxID=1922226 RepID=UPI000D562C4F